MDQRIEFLVRAREKRVPFSHLCEEYHISRQTGYAWQHRLEECGSFTGLQEHSRRPHHSPTKTPEALAARVLALRDEYGWGARKLQVLLAREGMALEEWTINRILQRGGRIRPEPVQGQARQRFAREQPNQLYQLDFKGEYSVAEGREIPGREDWLG
jgi:transposase